MAIIAASGLPVDGTTADAADVNTTINTIIADYNGNITNANISASAAIAGSKLATASLDVGSLASVWDGWIAVSDSWTYASATTVTVPSDATTKYSVGDKVKLVQTTTKYFYVTAVAATTLTLNGGTDYTVANAAISSIYYSKVATPLSFPQFFSYTPTWTNFTVGNGTLNEAKFNLLGKKAWVKVRFTLGSSSSMSTSPNFTLPITSAAIQAGALGNAYFDTGGGTTYVGDPFLASTTTCGLTVKNSSATYTTQTGITSLIPNTWGTGYIIFAYVVYEVA